MISSVLGGSPKAFWIFVNRGRLSCQYGVFSGPYFPYSDWIRKDTQYLSVFSPNAGKYGPEKTPYLGTFHAVRYSQDLPFSYMLL